MYTIVMTKKVLLLIFLLLPIVAFAQQTEQQPFFEAPETLEEGKEFAEQFSGLPRIMQNIWKYEVLPVWIGMFGWVEDIWEGWVEQPVESFITKTRGILTGKIQEEVEKEKEEVAKEFQREGHKVSESLLERFKALFKED